MLRVATDPVPIAIKVRSVARFATADRGRACCTGLGAVRIEGAGRCWSFVGFLDSFLLGDPGSLLLFS
ncbi:hypothetical protein D3C74_432820 [compost metagenome]